MSVNKVIILGRVGADPEVKYMPNGTAITQLSLATNRKTKSPAPKKAINMHH